MAENNTASAVSLRLHRSLSVQSIGAVLSTVAFVSMIAAASSIIDTTSGTLAFEAVISFDPMSRLLDGFLFGVLFPIADICSISFLILIGARASFLKEAQIACLAYLTATIFGAGVFTIGLKIPLLSMVCALPLLVMGVMSIFKVTFALERALCFYFVAGLLHGACTSAAIIETTDNISGMSLFGHFAGMFLGQYAIIFLSSWVAYTYFHVRGASSPAVRVLGFAVAMLGSWTTVGHLPFIERVLHNAFFA